MKKIEEKKNKEWQKEEVGVTTMDDGREGIEKDEKWFFDRHKLPFNFR